MNYPTSQTDELKQYCSGLSALTEGDTTYLYMEGLHLPAGCEPTRCDALFCPVPTKDGYPSRLYLATQVSSRYTRNWNCSNARIGERNWFAFSWKVDMESPTLKDLLVAHLNGFAKVG